MGGTVLILRSCPDNHDCWSSELEDLGYTVLYAEEPNQALVHLRSGVDIVVVIDGRRSEEASVFSRFVQSMSEERSSTPFVLISESPSAPSESARLGAAAFLPQPCKADDLQHVFSRMIGRQPAARVAHA